MENFNKTLLGTLLAVYLSACSGSGGSSPSVSQSPNDPSPTPSQQSKVVSQVSCVNGTANVINYLPTQSSSWTYQIKTYEDGTRSIKCTIDALANEVSYPSTDASEFCSINTGSIVITLGRAAGSTSDREISGSGIYTRTMAAEINLDTTLPFETNLGHCFFETL